MKPVWIVLDVIRVSSSAWSKHSTLREICSSVVLNPVSLYTPFLVLESHSLWYIACRQRKCMYKMIPHQHIFIGNCSRLYLCITFLSCQTVLGIMAYCAFTFWNDESIIHYHCSVCKPKLWFWQPIFLLSGDTVMTQQLFTYKRSDLRQQLWS